MVGILEICTKSIDFTVRDAGSDRSVELRRIDDGPRRRDVDTHHVECMWHQWAIGVTFDA
jgi:hypothetical protein